MAGGTRQSGFTLLELMVVVIIIGVLSTIAVLGIRKTSYAGTPLLYAERLAAHIDTARLRAVARNRWQRFDVVAANPRRVVHFECDDEGLIDPINNCTNWTEVRTLFAPAEVQIVSSTNTITAINPGDGSFTTADQFLHISPTGSGLYPAYGFAGTTWFIRDDRDRQRVRVVTYPASVTAYAVKGY